MKSISLIIIITKNKLIKIQAIKHIKIIKIKNKIKIIQSIITSIIIINLST